MREGKARRCGSLRPGSIAQPIVGRGTGHGNCHTGEGDPKRTTGGVQTQQRRQDAKKVPRRKRGGRLDEDQLAHHPSPCRTKEGFPNDVNAKEGKGEEAKDDSLSLSLSLSLSPREAQVPFFPSLPLSLTHSLQTCICMRVQGRQPPNKKRAKS